jgi:hypothetical protein
LQGLDGSVRLASLGGFRVFADGQEVDSVRGRHLAATLHRPGLKKGLGYAMQNRVPRAVGPYILGPFGPDTDCETLGTPARETKRAALQATSHQAVARKVAVLLHRLLVTGEVYEPLRHAGAGEDVAT